MIYSSIQKMSFVKAAKFFFYPNFTMERFKTHAEIDQNFDLTEFQRLQEKQRFDQRWEATFVAFFAEKKLALPSGFKNWIECLTSVNVDMEHYNAEVTKKQLLEDVGFSSFLKDTIRNEVAGNNTNEVAGTRRDRQEGGNEAALLAAPKDPIRDAAIRALNDFYSKHEIIGDNKNKLWGALCKKKLTARTNTPFDEVKVRAVCAELNIPLKDEMNVLTRF